jgi:amino acid transporter
MSSTGVDYAHSPPGPHARDGRVVDAEKHALDRPPSVTESESPGKIDHTHRQLKARHIQLIGIGGTIGTALYVQIGKGLLQVVFRYFCPSLIL